MDNFVIDSDQIYNYLQDQIEIACFYRRFKYPPKFIPFYVRCLIDTLYDLHISIERLSRFFL